MSKGLSYADEDSQDADGLAIVKRRLFLPLAKHHPEESWELQEAQDTLPASSLCPWAAVLGRLICSAFPSAFHLHVTHIPTA